MKMKFNIKERKKELINENIRSSELASRGQKRAALSVLVILFIRLAFTLFDCIYLAAAGADNSFWIQILIVPLVFILYLIYDGNRAMSYILMISSAGRLIYHFSMIIPSLPTEGVTFYTIIYLLVFEIQLGFAIFMTASSKCHFYFTEMQKINLKLRAEMLGKK